MSGMDIPYHIQNKQEYKEKIKKIIMEEVKNETKMNYDLNKIIDNAVNIGMTRTPKIQMDYGRQPQAVGEIKKDKGFKNEIKEVMKKLLKAQQEEEDKERKKKEEERQRLAEEERQRLADQERKAATTIQAAVRRRKARLAAAENLKELLNKEEMSINDAMNYFDNDVKQENIAYEFISIEKVTKLQGMKNKLLPVRGGKKQAKKLQRRANKTKRVQKSNKKKRKPKRKTMRKIKKIIFR